MANAWAGFRAADACPSPKSHDQAASEPSGSREPSVKATSWPASGPAGNVNAAVGRALTVIATVAGCWPCWPPVRAIYLKESVPVKPMFGVYVNIPLGSMTTVPCCGHSTISAVVWPSTTFSSLSRTHLGGTSVSPPVTVKASSWATGTGYPIWISIDP